MDRRRAAGALLALAACVACSTAAPTASNQTALELLEGPIEGCYYNFQHYGEGDRIMTNEPCLNCTCHNRMLMCYLRVCPFTKPIGQDCTIEKRADQCCPIVTCPDVPVDLLTSTSTSSPAEYGATGLGKVDKYGCSINGKYFSEGSKVPPTPNKPCEHCYCIRNMTTCVMQECTLHVDGCTPIYHKDVCCPVRYSCDHQEDEMLLLDDMSTTVRPTPGFLLTTTVAPVTQMSQDCVHDDQIFADGASIKTEKACEHCYCMKGDIVCIVQECGTPMENEGKNCTSLPPRQGQCCPDTYICEGDELVSDVTDGVTYEDLTTLSPPRRVEGSGYRNEPDEPYTEMSTFEGSGEETATTLDTSDMLTSQKETPQIIDEVFPATEESISTIEPMIGTIEPDKGQNTVPDDEEIIPDSHLGEKTTLAQEATITTQSTVIDGEKEKVIIESKTTISDYHYPAETDSGISKEDELILTTESGSKAGTESTKISEMKPDIEKETTVFNNIEELTTSHTYLEPSSPEPITLHVHEDKLTTSQPADLSTLDGTFQPTTNVPRGDAEYQQNNEDKLEEDKYISTDKDSTEAIVTTIASKIESLETTSVNPIENEIDEDVPQPGRIPGEGDCLLNGITYKNNTNVPNINNCHSSCKCVSSIVKCDPIICSPPPEHMDNMNDCQPIYDTPDACCPTYVCHSRETIPPESHNQMSETESPKATSEKSETECQGAQCHVLEITPSPEICNSEHCKTEVQEKECKNGVCIEHGEPSSDVPPTSYQEGCVGETCLTSEESCADGKCQQPSTSDNICNDENKCQPSEAEPCNGQNCVDGSGVIAPKDEIPICEDSDGCKASDSTDISKPACKDDPECDKTESNKNIHQPECTEESCRRKETTGAKHEPEKCYGSDCKAQEVVKDETSILTTEPFIKDQFKESTTEHVYDDFSMTPESEKTVSVNEVHKVTESVLEVTEKQETSPDSSTEKFEDLAIPELVDVTTERQIYYTEPTISFVTKAEETITEINIQPEIEKHETVSSESYTTKPEEQVTDHVEKEVSSESSITTRHEERFTKLPKEEVDGTTEMVAESSPTESPIVISDIGSHDTDTSEIPDIITPEEFTLKPTETSITLAVTTQQQDADINVLEQEHTKKQETYTDLPQISDLHEYTKSPEIHTTDSELFTSERKTEEPNKFVIKETESTESEMDVAVTESAVTVLGEILTEKSEDGKVKDDDPSTGSYAVTETVHKDKEQVTSAVGNEDETFEAFTTEQSIPTEHSSEFHETKVEDVTDKMYDDSQKDQILTEKPFETTSHDLYLTEKDLQSPQVTDTEAVTERLDTGVQDTEKSTKGQHEYTDLPEIFETVSNKEDVHTTPTDTQEYSTSSINLDIHTTVPSITEEKLTTSENLTPERGETVPPEVPIKELHTTSVPQDVDINESSTKYPHVAISTLQDITTSVMDIIKDSSGISGISEDHTGMPEETFLDDTTLQGPTGTETIGNSFTPGVTDSEEQVTSKPFDGEVTTGKVTTTSSILLDVSTKHAETQTGPDRSEENTLVPEIFASTLEETGEKTLESLTTKRVESESPTTESLKHPIGEVNDITEETPIQEEHTVDYNFDKETTEANVMLITDKQVDTEEKAPIIPNIDTTNESEVTVPIIVPDSETEETPLITKPDTYETETQLPEKHETSLPEEPVTETIDSDVNGEEIRTEYPVHITDVQNTFAPEAVTQTQDAEVELVTEYHTEISTIPIHIIKHDKEQTESPMSLVTEIGEHLTSSKPIYEEHDSSGLVIDRTTQSSMVSTPGAEKIDVPVSQETEPNKFITELPHSTISDVEYESKTPSHAYTNKENVPEATSETEQVTPSSSTENIKLDISTEAAEKLSPTIEYQEQTTLVPDPTTVVSGSSEILSESTSTSPLGVTLTVKEEEVPTKSGEVSNNISTILYDSESGITPQNVPEEEETLIEATTSKSKITEMDQIGVTDSKIQPFEAEQTMSPELFTTKYQEPSGYEHETVIGDHKPSIQQENVTSPDDFITTEKVIYSDKPLSHDTEIHSTVMLDQNIPTKTPEIFDVERDTTTTYQDSTTIKDTDMLEVHLSTSGIKMTESSHIPIDEEDHKGTPSSEQFETETHEIPSNEPKTPELPEVTKVSEIEHPYTTQTMSTTILEGESVTSVPEKEHSESEYNTPTSLSTEGELLLQTGTVVSQDQHIPVVTEMINKYTTEAEDITATAIHTKPGDLENLQTELPISVITEKDETVVETTFHEDKATVPVDTTHKTLLESETSLPKESEIEASTSKESETTVSIETQPDKSVTQKSETTIIVESETEMSAPLETEYPVTVETETELFVPQATEVPVSKSTESSSVPIITDSTDSAPIESENITPISKETESLAPVDKATETSIQKETEMSVPIETETETSIPKVTETETEISEETEISVPKATEASIPEVTEVLVQSETEPAVTEHESTTYLTKDKESIAPEELPTASEASYSSSETTPYLIELQEHTNKFDEAISSIIPVDTQTTKGTETYQTERGDQPIETVTDKTTEEDFHMLHTSEETLAEKDEKSSTPALGPSNDYVTASNIPEEISHETEANTEKFAMSPEPSAVTSSGTQNNDNLSTIYSEEPGSTVIPTVTLKEHDKLTTADISTETSTNKKDLSLETEKVPEHETVHETTASENELPPVPKTTTIKTPLEATTQFPIVHEKPEEKPELPKPGVGETAPTEELPLPDFPTSGTSGYGQEPDYVDQEDQAFGPGTCRYGGKVYVSAQQIPRDDPCDFCFCFRSDIICLQQSCPPPIHGCHEEPIQGFCCPRYECPVSMATTLNVTTTTTTTTTTLPPHFLPHAYKGAAQRRGCQIKGHTYKVGDVVRASSGPCLHCTCGGDGQMKCDPKACTPEPMLRQMIAAAVSAKRRR